MKKITKAEKFAMIKNLADVQANPMLVEFIDHELDLLAKKNTVERKPTEKQVANADIGLAIVDYMKGNPDRLFTITELMKEVPACGDLTNQRVSAIVRPLIGTDIERVEDKRKALFRYLAH